MKYNLIANKLWNLEFDPIYKYSLFVQNMDQKANLAKMDSKFASHYDAIEEELKSNTVGIIIFILYIIWFMLKKISRIVMLRLNALD